MNREYRSTLDRDLPPPAVPEGSCEARTLAHRLTSGPRRREIPECPNPASRRVQVGLNVRANVCLWHSLTACEQLGARLLRSP